MSQHQSILEFKRGRYFKLALLLCVASFAAYAWHEPSSSQLKPYGGTWLGYTLGTIAALLILWLMLLGVRKRSYSSTLGSVQGWTSAHVFLGASLIVIATLHCAFEFGWNIHTLAYALMVVVVGSGMFGVFSYMLYPARMTNNLAGETLDSLLLKMSELDRKCRRIALELPDEFNALVMKASADAVRHADSGKSLRPWWLGGRGRNRLGEARDALLVMGTSLSGAQVKANEQLVSEMTRLVSMTERVRLEFRLRALLKGWLVLHVPMSFALLAALTAHVISVFYLW
jgi:hypothetical protein